ncbi:unnamed protein product [Prorocentrum cordatum]|uniref:PAP-associated domain-containing protein n=1 Tax=Prorocentrum cordatum TaxID=2364126 RepID=A0ABN9W2U0_9DINO|nr:unnamed protein product [Polarella glacialis]
MRRQLVRPDLAACGAAISACEKGGQCWEALRLLHHMEERGPQPSAIAYDAVLRALSRAGAWQESLGLLQRRAARGLRPGRSALAATVRALGTPGAPLELAGAALGLFEAGVEDVSRLDLEERGCGRRGPLYEFWCLLSVSLALKFCSELVPFPRGRHLRAEWVGVSIILLLSCATLLTSLPLFGELCIVKFVVGIVFFPLKEHDARLEADAGALAARLEARHACLQGRAEETRGGGFEIGVRGSGFPSASLHLYGSVLEGTAGGGDDLDFTAEVADAELCRGLRGPATPDLLRLVALRDARGLARGSEAWRARSAAFAVRTPSLALWHVPSGSKVDLTINKFICVEKNMFLRARSDPLARRLVSLVKVWARRRQIYGRGRLCGFGFAQLAIFYTQVSSQPARGEQGVARSLSRLLRGFFRFYAHELDWAKECVSVASGRRTLKGSPRMRGMPHLCIEDCLEREVDLCIPHLPEAEGRRLRRELRRGAELLLAEAPSLDALLQESVAANSGNSQGRAAATQQHFRQTRYPKYMRRSWPPPSASSEPEPLGSGAAGWASVTATDGSQNLVFATAAKMVIVSSLYWSVVVVTSLLSFEVGETLRPQPAFSDGGSCSCGSVGLLALSSSSTAAWRDLGKSASVVPSVGISPGMALSCCTVTPPAAGVLAPYSFAASCFADSSSFSNLATSASEVDAASSSLRGPGGFVDSLRSFTTSSAK